MTRILKILSIAVALLVSLSACGKDDVPTPPVEPNDRETPEALRHTDVYRRHKESPLKILAIGNSFTHNAATYLPHLIETINADSICIAKLTRSGCSLSMHWSSHLSNIPDYDFFYSDSGKWEKSEEIKTIDDALALFSWDVIVMQQASGESGYYSKFQPYLDYLLALLKETNPGALTAWHYTWPYREGTDHPYFADYGKDPEIMYKAILEACDKASVGFDIKIPSASLIWEMRRQYPEAEDGFSADGYHISDKLALYALSTLWYECLIAPYTGTDSMHLTAYPDSLTADRLERALAIISDLLAAEKN